MSKSDIAASRRPLHRPETLAARVAKELREELRTRSVVSGRLPAESVLAAQFGVSRGTVRQALTILERDGFILRRQGSGTYVHKYISRVQSRAEHAYEFTELLELAGFEAGIELISCETMAIAARMAVQLDVEPDTDVLVVRKIFLADGSPAIYCQDFIPVGLIVEPYEQVELEQPIFDFMYQRCHQASVQNMAEIIPVVATQELARLLDMGEGDPLLKIDETGYNSAGEPNVFTRAYYKDKYIRFSLLRTRI